MTQNIKNLNANAAQPGLNQTGVKGLPIVLPSKPILELFDTKATPILDQIFNLAKRNHLLRRTRDLLLPKLVSGDVSVDKIKVGGR